MKGGLTFLLTKEFAEVLELSFGHLPFFIWRYGSRPRLGDTLGWPLTTHAHYTFENGVDLVFHLSIILCNLQLINKIHSLLFPEVKLILILQIEGFEYSVSLRAVIQINAADTLRPTFFINVVSAGFKR